MPIHTAKGDIMDFATSRSEAVAIWMCSGFNSRNSIWRWELNEKLFRIKLEHPLDRYIDPDILNSAYKLNPTHEPWKLSFETLWSMTSEDQKKLKYLYIFPNPDDQIRLENIEQIDSLIVNCLEVLNKNSIKSVSFILIPAYLNKDESNNDINDIASANQMIESINNWLNNNNSEMEVYLVDRQDGFSPLLNN